MRTRLILVVSVALYATLVTFPAEAKKGASESGQNRTRSSVFKVEVDKSHALDDHQMVIRMSRPPGKVMLTVKTEEGAIIADIQEDFTGKSAGNPLTV